MSVKSYFCFCISSILTFTDYVTLLKKKKLLQRNLKIMISMGLSAKQEKDNRFQQIKKEVVEMIKERVPSLESKVCSAQFSPSLSLPQLGFLA